MMINVRKKAEAWLRRRGIEHPEVRWLVSCQIVLACVLTAGLWGASGSQFGPGFGVGALLVTLNFYLLAKLVPQLIWVQKGGVFALLTSFYIRLVITGIALFLAIVWAKLSAIAVIAGLSTILVTFAVWAGKFIVTKQHKEA